MDEYKKKQRKENRIYNLPGEEVSYIFRKFCSIAKCSNQ